MTEEEACRIREMCVWDYRGVPCTTPADRLSRFIITALLYWICWVRHLVAMTSFFFFFPTQRVQGRYFQPAFVEVETEAQRDQSHLPGKLQGNHSCPALSTQPGVFGLSGSGGFRLGPGAAPGSSESGRSAGSYLGLSFEEGHWGLGTLCYHSF